VEEFRLSAYARRPTTLAEMLRARGIVGVVFGPSVGEGRVEVAWPWGRDERWPGVSQRYDLIAGHAVDLVVAQVQRNERGVPETARALLFGGRWEGELGDGGADG
jgi:hypothetical protein